MQVWEQSFRKIAGVIRESAQIVSYAIWTKGNSWLAFFPLSPLFEALHVSWKTSSNDSEGPS